MARGSWSVVRDSWFVARDSWLVVRGSWSMVRGKHHRLARAINADYRNLLYLPALLLLIPDVIS